MSKNTVAEILTGLIPLYAPMLVAGLKKLIGHIPGVFLPGVAVVIGVLGQALLAWIDGRAADPIWGAMLGAGGIAIRDLMDQIKKLQT